MASSANRKTKKKNSLAGLQDERLTSRHIAALMKLDDALLENEKLKSRVDLLEKETGSCLELHEIARNGKQTLMEAEMRFNEEKKKMQNSYETKIFENEQQTQTHICEIFELKKENEELKDHISDLKTLFNQIKEKHEMNEVNEINLLKNTNNELEDQSIQCKNELQLVLGKVTTLQEDNIDLKKLLESIQLKSDDLSEENIKLRKCIDYEEENRHSLVEKEGDDEKSCDEHIEKDEKIKELTKKLSLYEMERQVIIQSSSVMEIEIQHLKQKVSSHNVTENVIERRGVSADNSTRQRSTGSANKNKLKYVPKK